MKNHSLMSVAEMAMATGMGESLVFDEVAKALEGFETSEAHRMVSDFNWRLIATTNYDRFLEDAYGDTKRRRQTLVPFVKDSEPVEDRMAAVANPVQYLKLHGSIDHRLDKEVPLVLSWEHYDRYEMNRKRLFERLQYFAPESVIIFVGYSLGDAHIRKLIYALDGAERPRWYTVDPGAEDEDIAFWGTRNIDVLKCGFGEFMTALDQSIEKLSRFVTPPQDTIAFPLRDFYAVPSEESEAVKLAIGRDLTLVHASMPYAEQTPERFYSGYDTGWGCIFNRLDARRRVTDDLLYKALLEYEKPTGPVFFLLQGPAGSGKTIVLKRAAFDAATANKALVLWLEEEGQLRPEVFLEIADLVKRPIYLFVDQVALHAEKLVKFLDVMKTKQIPLVLVSAEREADWSTYCHVLGDQFPPMIMRIGVLGASEVENLLDLLQRHNCLGELAGKPREEQVAAFLNEEQADRQLLVALHVLTRGLPFEEIVLREYQSVNQEQARRLYLDIATMNQFGVPVRAGTISRISGIRFREYEERFFQPLKDIVLTGFDEYSQDYAYRTRHARVAQILFRQVCVDDQLKVAQLTRLIAGLDVGYSSDRRALEGICRGRTLVETFSSVLGPREVFEAATKSAPQAAYLYQQWAIFESTHKEGDLLEAEQLAARASAMSPRNPTFLHTQAEVARKRAVAEGSPVLKAQLRRKARSFLDRMPKDDRFTVSSRCKLLVDEVADLGDSLSDGEHLSEDQFFAEKLQDAESALDRGQQEFPNDAEMYEIEARLWGEIKDKGRVLGALERAWARGPRGNGTAIRLGKIYAAAGDAARQLAILKEALQRRPDDKPTHFALALHLLGDPAADLRLIESHLRQSFSSDDQNFEARYTLGEFLFLKGDVQGTMDTFADIAKRAPREFRRQAPRQETAVTARLPLYSGTIEAVNEGGFCFIRTGSYPRPVFAHWSSFSTEDQGHIEVGRQVVLRIRFNRSGPTAVEVRGR